GRSRDASVLVRLMSWGTPRLTTEMRSPETETAAGGRPARGGGRTVSVWATEMGAALGAGGCCEKASARVEVAGAVGGRTKVGERAELVDADHLEATVVNGAVEVHVGGPSVARPGEGDPAEPRRALEESADDRGVARRVDDD